MLNIDSRSAVPVHEQIKAGLRVLVARGLLKPGDQLSPATAVAETLLVSPNSVIRAYRELIKEQFLVHTDEDRILISERATDQVNQTLGEILQNLLQTLGNSRRSGLTWDDVESIVRFLKTQEEPGAEKMIPEILKRLYFDSSATHAGKAACPYCRESIDQDTKSVSCVLCRTIHHQECWNEGARCSVFGCKGKVCVAVG